MQAGQTRRFNPLAAIDFNSAAEVAALAAALAAGLDWANLTPEDEELIRLIDAEADTLAVVRPHNGDA